MNTQAVNFSSSAGAAARLDQIGWGIFLMMIAVIWLLPAVPEGTWLLGTGVLLLLLNAIRMRMGIPSGWVSVVLGVLALAAGLGDLTGIALPLFPICLLLMGASLIVKPLVSARA